ncbi:MAG: endonuclease/exonuclease/phosphatase family protein [Candidatus Paceibacterota bacterium]
MKLISLNIELNEHREKVLSFLKKEDPDVVCLQELLEEDLQRFKNELGMDGVFEVWRYVNDSHRLECKGKRFGTAIFAKNILNSGHFFYMGSKENISRSFDEYLMDENLKENNVFIWIETENNNGEKFKFITTHLPVTEHGEVTEYQLEVVDSLLEELQKSGEFILCGDTNAPRGRESFDRISRKYKDNIPKEYKTSLDQNLHRVKGLQYMVDGLFTTPGYIAENVKLVDGVSDHMAIVANMSAH